MSLFRRGTDIPQVIGGEALNPELLNQVIKGADTNRQVSVGSGIKASMLNNSLNLSLKSSKTQRPIPVQIEPYGKSSVSTETVTKLSDGFYYGRAYLQPNIIYQVSNAPSTQQVTPDPGAINCVVINYSEFYGGFAYGHAITAPTQSIATYVGSTTDGLPLYGVGIEKVRYGKITAATAINGLIEWLYTIQFGYMSAFSTTSAGTFTADGAYTVSAYNSAEDKNTFTGSGTAGVGVTVTSTTGIVSGSCVLQKIPVGAFVWCQFLGLDTNSDPFFSIVNFTNSAQ